MLNMKLSFAMPALFTTIDGGALNTDRISFKLAKTLSFDETSIRMAYTFSPNDCWVSLTESKFWSTAMTFAPSRTNILHAAFPIPLPAPITVVIVGMKNNLFCKILRLVYGPYVKVNLDAITYQK